MASSYFRTLLQRQAAGVARSLRSEAVWALPAGLGAGWLLWPCLDLEWKISLGLAKDPDADMFRVQELRHKRYEAKFGVRPDAKKEAKDEDEEEKDEDEEEEEEPEEEEEQEESGAGGDDNDGAEDDDDDGAADDEEDEEPKIVVPPLFLPTKGKVSWEQAWDNATIKMVNWLSEDDDEDEDDE